MIPENVPLSADGPRAVYCFGGGGADGAASMKDLLGGKGANLAEMANLGVAVPPGFTISTEVCRRYLASGEVPADVHKDVRAALGRVEALLERGFGDPERPLLLSVRSGARSSMPGMMDTVLNLGLNAETVEGLARLSGDARFAWDSYRRFVQMYANVVLGLDGEVLEEALAAYKREHVKPTDLDLDAGDLRALVGIFDQRIREALGAPVPDDPYAQLDGAIEAVFRSWNTPRAARYRKIHRIPHDWGTAVNVQAMVFGNLGETSATGVAFTRNPATGTRAIYGEYLANAQGEDVVAGIRTPGPLNEHSRSPSARGASMEAAFPEAYTALAEVLARLERHYGDVQDVEFTLERGVLWVLQTRNAKRTGRAAVRAALDMLDEGLIDEATALLRVDPDLHMQELMHPTIDPAHERPAPIAAGLAASPGAAVGAVCLRSEEAVVLAEQGRKVILVRQETSPDDIHGMHAAAGILTATGGLTSHAAVVARGMGKPCITGAGDLVIDAAGAAIEVGGRRIEAGATITIDGTTGEVYDAALPLVEPQVSGDLERLLGLADGARRLGVRANADAPEDAARARGFGAEGIGLCRTEHMFFAPEERLRAVQAMILAETDKERARALERLLPPQREDFRGILEAMDGLPVVVRLLDPPLHEFLPVTDEDVRAVAADLGVSERRVRARVQALHEHNPMLGHRGCRLGITSPAIYLMQTEALVLAAIDLKREGRDPIVEIMIPLVACASELGYLVERVERRVRELLEGAGVPLEVKIGTMIELPRAALTAGAIARHAHFFSFGTNDLTQATFGLSRDDAGRFLPIYLEKGILSADPFASLDEEGVGELVSLGTARGRAARPDLEVGICGEHGGDPASIAFCHATGLDYVSCSPFRVPVARLAAAQAALRSRPA